MFILFVYIANGNLQLLFSFLYVVVVAVGKLKTIT